MRRVSHLNPDYSHFVEVHPTGRYGRYDEVVCRSDSKTVYRSFDEYRGIEVAWNQVKSYDFVQSTEDLKKLDTEISLAKTFKHKNIIKFYTSSLDTATGNINFLTEMFTSTLRQYRLKNRRVSVWTVKHWCRQILRGLVYLHSQNPPVIHRDLRSDNIFINGTQGEVKIGDLGLSGIVHSASFVGTLEFVAPEVYEEAYNELADIYSFGMCILEMVTSEIPYSECADPFEFFEKLKSGVKPDALYRVNDPEIREFVEKCLAPASLRLSATELLNDPFLQIKDSKSDLRLLDYPRKVNDGFGTPIPESAKNSQRQLQWLGNTNNERYNLVGARSSERHVMAGRKPQDSVTNNPLGVKASVWSVIHAKKLPVSDQASSCFGNNPTIY